MPDANHLLGTRDEDNNPIGMTYPVFAPARDGDEDRGLDALTTKQTRLIPYEAQFADRCPLEITLEQWHEFLYRIRTVSVSGFGEADGEFAKWNFDNQGPADETTVPQFPGLLVSSAAGLSGFVLGIGHTTFGSSNPLPIGGLEVYSGDVFEYSGTVGSSGAEQWRSVPFAMYRESSVFPLIYLDATIDEDVPVEAPVTGHWQILGFSASVIGTLTLFDWGSIPIVGHRPTSGDGGLTLNVTVSAASYWSYGGKWDESTGERL